MKTWTKMLIVTVVLGIIAVPLGQILWPAPSGEMGSISGMEMALFILFSLYEGLALGFGVAFLIFGMPLVRRANLGSQALTWGSFLSIVWMLVSWWPHDGLHRAGLSMQALLAVEYGFHLTLMIGSVILAIAFMRVARNAAAAAAPEQAAARPAPVYETAAG